MDYEGLMRRKKAHDYAFLIFLGAFLTVSVLARPPRNTDEPPAAFVGAAVSVVVDIKPAGLPAILPDRRQLLASLTVDKSPQPKRT